MMNCPRDGTILADAKVNGCKLEKCPTCCGLWLDSGVLEELMHLRLENAERIVQVLPYTENGEPSHISGYMRCPKCIDGRLQTISYTLSCPTRIDRCEKCLGLWVDEHELDTIIREEKWLESEYSQEKLRDLLNDQSSSPP